MTTRFFIFLLLLFPLFTQAQSFVVEVIQGDNTCLPGDDCTINMQRPFVARLRNTRPDLDFHYEATKLTLISTKGMQNTIETPLPISYSESSMASISNMTGVFSGGRQYSGFMTLVFDEIYKVRGTRRKRVNVPIHSRSIRINGE